MTTGRCEVSAVGSDLSRPPAVPPIGYEFDHSYARSRGQHSKHGRTGIVGIGDAPDKRGDFAFSAQVIRIGHHYHHQDAKRFMKVSSLKLGVALQQDSVRFLREQCNRSGQPHQCEARDCIVNLSLRRIRENAGHHPNCGSWSAADILYLERLFKREGKATIRCVQAAFDILFRLAPYPWTSIQRSNSSRLSSSQSTRVRSLDGLTIGCQLTNEQNDACTIQAQSRQPDDPGRKRGCGPPILPRIMHCRAPQNGKTARRFEGLCPATPTTRADGEVQ